jgi:hypothetical protein
MIRYALMGVVVVQMMSSLPALAIEAVEGEGFGLVLSETAKAITGEDIVGLSNEAIAAISGKSLDEVAELRGTESGKLKLANEMKARLADPAMRERVAKALPLSIKSDLGSFDLTKLNEMSVKKNGKVAELSEAAVTRNRALRKGMEMVKKAGVEAKAVEGAKAADPIKTQSTTTTSDTSSVVAPTSYDIQGVMEARMRDGKVSFDLANRTTTVLNEAVRVAPDMFNVADVVEMAKELSPEGLEKWDTMAEGAIEGAKDGRGAREGWLAADERVYGEDRDSAEERQEEIGAACGAGTVPR